MTPTPHFSLSVRWMLLLGIVLLIALIYSVHSVLLPFIVAVILAYLLDPAADWLETKCFPRWAAVATIFLAGLLIGAGLLTLLAPLIAEQILHFIERVPFYKEQIQHRFLPTLLQWANHIDPSITKKAQSLMNELSGKTLSVVGDVLINIWQSGIAALNMASLLFITPIVTFYLLRDWDLLLIRLKLYCPLRYRFRMVALCKEIHEVLAGYLRGQLHVCLLLAAFYGIGLPLTGLEFGLLIGLCTGLFSFIPYVGFAVGCIVGLTVGFIQFHSFTALLPVIGVYMAGQVLETNILTPKLVGDKVGLHPVWLIFSLLAGASMGGFVGMLLAVPVAATIGVLVRLGLRSYLESEWFKRT